MFSKEPMDRWPNKSSKWKNKSSKWSNNKPDAPKVDAAKCIGKSNAFQSPKTNTINELLSTMIRLINLLAYYKFLILPLCYCNE